MYCVRFMQGAARVPVLLALAAFVSSGCRRGQPVTKLTGAPPAVSRGAGGVTPVSAGPASAAAGEDIFARLARVSVHGWSGGSLSMPRVQVSVPAARIEASVLRYLCRVIRREYLPRCGAGGDFAVYVPCETAGAAQPASLWIEHCAQGARLRIHATGLGFHIGLLDEDASGAREDAVKSTCALLNRVFVPDCSPRGRQLGFPAMYDGLYGAHFQYSARVDGWQVTFHVWTNGIVANLFFSKWDVALGIPAGGTGADRRPPAPAAEGPQGPVGREATASTVDGKGGRGSTQPTTPVGPVGSTGEHDTDAHDTGEPAGQSRDDSAEAPGHAAVLQRAVATARTRRTPVAVAEIIKALESGPRDHMWDDALLVVLASVREDDGADALAAALRLAQQCGEMELDEWTVTHWPDCVRISGLAAEFTGRASGVRDFARWCVIEEMHERAERLRRTGGSAAEARQLEGLVLEQARLIAGAWPGTEMARRCVALMEAIPQKSED